MNIQSEEKVVQIPISQIRDFPEHPYKVKDDESMNELVDSIMQRGLIQPVIIRPTEDGNYEMVSGHRRKRAFEIAGMKNIPARVKEMTKGEAILAMVDSNLQREVILPSEKAFAYKMRLEAMKRQGERTDLTSVPVAQKSKTSRELLGEEVGESQDQIRRYIRLTNLIPELLELVDEGRIAMRPAVEISYLPEEAQMQLYETIDYNDATPSHYQAIRLRNFHRDGKLTPEVIEAIMSEEKPNQKEKSPFRDKRIVGVIPKNIPQERHCEYVIKAIDFYNRHLERVRNNRSR
ncbi:MAG: ParB/RepB/Spo0J family partition protein [Acutalibacteraceae bacterium]|nr:ParB/RepB/Spo0J family partition protein [Acutalibacteraceae bacterium]